MTSQQSSVRAKIIDLRICFGLPIIPDLSPPNLDESGLDLESRMPGTLITRKSSLAMKCLEAERVADADEMIHRGRG